MSVQQYNYLLFICILNMKCLAYIIPEKNVTQIYLEKTEKWINKEKFKSNAPDSLS